MTVLLSGATADHYATTLHDVVDDLARRVRSVQRPRSGTSRSALERMVAEVDLDAPGAGTEAALAEVAELYVDHAVWFHDPGYLAHLNCPVAIPAVAAEALLAAVNTSVDTYDQSAVATLMERRVVEWTARRIGFPSGDGVFTSGGTQSNLQALFLAREHALAGQDDRARAMPRLRVLATDQTHFSVRKAARLLGLAADAVVPVATDDLGRMRPDALVAAVARVQHGGDVVAAVVATAGTTDRGCLDPLEPVADVCDDAGVWLHVDAAYGCGLLVSRTRRHLLAGIERARSVTVDFHKAFFQPVSSSALVVRDGLDLAPVAWHADYLNPSGEDEPNQVDKSLQTTRRFDALKLWCTLRALGPDAIGDMVDACCDLAARVHEALADDPELRVVAPTQLSTVLFRYEPPGLDRARADALVAQVRRELLETGQAVVARTVVEDVPCLKLTLLDPTRTLEQVLDVVELVRETALRLLAAEDAGLLVQPAGVRR